MTNTIIPVGGNVEGNITSCGIDTKLISVQRDSAVSFFQGETYRSYSVCNGQEIATYTTHSFTGLGVLSCIVTVFFLVIIFAAWIDS